MERAEIILIGTLVATNTVAAVCLAVPIARRLADITMCSDRMRRYGVMLFGIYVLECAAFASGMATQVFTVALAFVWGALFGFWLRRRAPERQIIQAMVQLALYTSLPTLSFAVLVPVSWMVSGRSIVSLAAGSEFGIPELVPWPLNTVLGFTIALAAGTVLLKVFITVGGASLLLHHGSRKSAD